MSGAGDRSNLVFAQTRGSGNGQAGVDKEIGDRVILGDVPSTYRVFIFYFPSALPDPRLRETLEAMGTNAGGNLLMTFVGLDDTNYDTVATLFDVKTLPSIVVTAVGDLAMTEASENLFVKIDHQRLLSDKARLIQLLEHLYLQFLNGEVAAAAATVSWSQRTAGLRQVGEIAARALRAIGDFLSERDFSFSAVTGTFEMRKRGSGDG